MPPPSQGQTLAAANAGEIHLFDAGTNALIRTVQTTRPASTICFLSNSVFCVGTRSPLGTIEQVDLRAPLTPIRQLHGHKGAIAALACSPVGGPHAGSPEGGQQLASGGCDQSLLLWDARQGSGVAGQRPLTRLDKQGGPVLAVGWSPHQRGVLASGGGAEARELRIWDTKLQPRLEPVITAKAETTVSQSDLKWTARCGFALNPVASQICNLVWSETSFELATTHGHPSSVITVWK